MTPSIILWATAITAGAIAGACATAACNASSGTPTAVSKATRISSGVITAAYAVASSLDSGPNPALAFAVVPQLSLHTPVGDLSVSEEDGAIVALDWGWGSQQTPTSLLRRARDQLHAYFDGELTDFDLPLAPVGTAYRQRVWRALCAIPYAATRSYLDIARIAGGSPRSIGQANGNNPIPIVIPCHRVLATTHLGGYSGGEGLPTKRWLLAFEASRQPLLQPIPSAAA